MRKCVTIILVAAVQNVGIPIAIAFGPGETLEPHEQFSTASDSRFGTNLGGFPPQADQ
jgi:hypothetical protein